MPKPINRGFKEKDMTGVSMEKISFFVFAFLFAGIWIHLSSAAEPPSGPYEAPENVLNDFIKSVTSDLQKSKMVYDMLMSLERQIFPLDSFIKLSTYEKKLNEHARMLQFYRPHNLKLIEQLESEIRGAFLGFMGVVSIWFIRDTEALLDFVNLNKNMSLRTLFKSAKKLSHSDAILSYILRETKALPFGLIMVTLDLGKDWNTTGTRLNFSGEPISKVENNYDSSDIRSCLSSLRRFLRQACEIGFFPKDNGFLEQLEILIDNSLEKFGFNGEDASEINFFPKTNGFLEHLEILIISSLKKLVFNGEDASAFESWYRDCYSRLRLFLAHGSINNYSVNVVKENTLEGSVIEVKNCLESLKEEIKIPSNFDFSEISVFFYKFEYASFRLSTSDVLDKAAYSNSVLKESVVEFDKEILSPLYYSRSTELLTFLKSRNLKLIHFVLKLLNARGRYDISIENDKVLHETIYFNAFQLIEYKLYYETIYTGAKLDDFKLFISNFADILESFPEVVPKAVYDGPKMPLTNYIANLRYLIDNAEFDEESGIFDVNPLKTALSLIAETEKDSKYHCQVTLVIFYLINYYERVNINAKLGPFLLAMHKVLESRSYNKTYDNFYTDIGDIRKLLLAMKGATLTKTSLDWDKWGKELKRILRSQLTKK